MFRHIYSNRMARTMGVAYVMVVVLFFQRVHTGAQYSHLTNMHNTNKKRYKLGMLCYCTTFPQKYFYQIQTQSTGYNLNKGSVYTT